MIDLTDKVIKVYDIETPWITDGNISDISQIYCIGVVTIVNSELVSQKMYTEYWTTYSDGSLLECIADLNSADIRVAFNNISFDDVVIRNVLGVELKPTQQWGFPSLDLLLTSKILYSKDELIHIDANLDIDKKLWGSFSLRAFGARLGNNKMHYDEFDEGLTKDLCTYCLQDCVVTADLFLHVITQDNFPTDQVLIVEHKAASIIAEQESFGFYFNIEKGKTLNAKLLAEKASIARELSTVFKPKFLKKGTVQTYKKLSKVRKYLPNDNYIPLLGTK